MPSIRISQETFDRAKSLMAGQSWDLFFNKAMDHLCMQSRTNNNVSTDQEPTVVSAPYVEHNRAIILPSGTVLVDEERMVVDINGQPIIFPDTPSARKMTKYLKKYTGHYFICTVNPWRDHIITCERVYSLTADGDAIRAMELEETINFLRSNGMNPLATPDITSQPMRTIQAECV